MSKEMGTRRSSLQRNIRLCKILVLYEVVNGFGQFAVRKSLVFFEGSDRPC